MYIAVVVLTLVLYGTEGSSLNGCEIEVIRDDVPLIVETATTTFIYPPPGEQSILVNVGSTIELACPGRDVWILKAASSSSTLNTASSIVKATCIGGTTFNINGKAIQWDQIRCDGRPVSQSIRTNQSCAVGGIQGIIGFQLDAKRFAKLIEICFDQTKQITLYSKYRLSASIESADTSTPRPSFRQDQAFYTSIQSVNSLYLRKHQRKTINQQLGLDITDTKYIDNGNMNFLSRGHLTARTDFVYAAQMNATFKYINCVPQWQSVNRINWNNVEVTTRAYASNYRVDLDVWTGSYGIATLPHAKTQRDVPLYLYVDDGDGALSGGGGRTLLPVPALTWKILLNPKNGKGVVLISLNNPYDQNVKRNVICRDVSKSLQNFNQFDRSNVKRGFTYACEVPEFLTKIPHAPRIKVTGLLV